jgi:hypothetical protein
MSRNTIDVVRTTIHEAAWYPGIPEGAKLHIARWYRNTAWSGSRNVTIITDDPTDPCVITEVYLGGAHAFPFNYYFQFGLASKDRAELTVVGGVNAFHDYSRHPRSMTIDARYNVNNDGTILAGYVKYWRKNA